MAISYKLPKNERNVVYNALYSGKRGDCYLWDLVNYLMKHSTVKKKGHKRELMQHYFNSKEMATILKKHGVDIDTNDVVLGKVLTKNEFLEEFLQGFADYEALYDRK